MMDCSPVRNQTSDKQIPRCEGAYGRWGKRLFDLLLTVPSLIMAIPLLLLISVMVRCLLGRPVLFRQTRSGRDGKPFQILKFRTMTNDHDEQGNLLPDAERLPAFGHFLRQTSLDELPELINVLRGEMSLVGPRPLILEYNDRYNRVQRRRLETRPGLTGQAQINGRNCLTWEQKFDHDIWYVDRISLWLDLRIICLTPWKVLRSEGISAAGHATVEKFRGTPPDPDTMPVVVLGAGGHARVVISTLLAQERTVIAVLDDDDSLWGDTLLGVPVTGPLSKLESYEDCAAIIAIGNNAIRQRVAQQTDGLWTRVIHPHSSIDPKTEIDPGTVVMAGAVIQCGSRIGAHSIVNTSATIDHDCRIEEFVHVAPGCHLAGDVEVHRGTLLGIGSKVIPGMRIGADATIGAAAAVVRDVPDRVTVTGVPGRILSGSRTDRAA